MPVYVSRGLPEIVCASVRFKGVARDSLGHVQSNPRHIVS